MTNPVQFMIIIESY